MLGTTNQRSHSHVPAEGKHQPVSTYRIQLGPDVTFDSVIDQIPYLSDLGVTDIFLSPILQAAPGSTHGYDVVDHESISEELGGLAGFERASRAIHDAGMHVVVDIVPNHMAVPTPLYHNRALWSVLRDGEDSPYAHWFDVDVADGGDGLLLPVLGKRIGDVLAAGELVLDSMVVPGFVADGPVPVLRYYDHVFPVRAGTESLPLVDLLDRQFYRIAYWRVANEELNYRRFFDVDTLAAIRVEQPDVFNHSHALLIDLMKRGLIDSFRVDHPDGLADPREYFRHLHAATGGAWLVAEKILEADEELPNDWQCAGTTGYDALRRIQGVLTEPAGVPSVSQLYSEISGSTASVDTTEIEAKRQIVSTSLYAEVHRLATLLADVCHSDVRLRDHTFRRILDVVSELVVHMSRYRAYIVPGERAGGSEEKLVRDAALKAAEFLDDDSRETLEIVVDLLLGNESGSAGRTQEDRRREAIVRFQQVCGAVMAKGVEDTTFYRYTALLSANEVGGGPHSVVTSLDEFHNWQTYMHQAWPVSGVVTSTHDTKRCEDVRARISVLTQFSAEWVALVQHLRRVLAEQRPVALDGQFENLIWQTIIGTWTPDGPISTERLDAYLLKAAREQKLWTTWTEQDSVAEEGMLEYAHAIISTPESADALSAFAATIYDAVRANVLATCALHYTMVGVPDLYQGEEITQTSLVDPDNRRPVDYQQLHSMLTSMDEQGLPAHASLDEEKLWVTLKLLRFRRSHPQIASAAAGYSALPVSTGHAIAFARTVEDSPFLVTIAQRSVGLLQQASHTVVLPDGHWEDLLTGTQISGGSQLLSTLTERFPVAILVRNDS
ncbi:malto-oligosyltrehalose synthase [Arcanobacterium haemolyticum]|uniref:Malto-oligosyltrehalose synthase n=1 Tax=Arcanobacterium haemolyticum (strain ATCC 9345 / DSM 20595 / CCM 5947 / CCUG 17215 / LMG 16163 / NBRC 15585 / NCTC 8452 / 11018) TaxID=644284 RepID=D7BNM9_ARCHD|nr:malto-oligosyltrehalose synthase [Arcanobacterium haemolyticum]ADH92528.1 malto-oligosyltrehalose synthase [Arcanobacterium haemolyticum DSM 20595]QCX46649.1 malto-oligosyltrehalose synthase [Arcanobacterium haemolyticum]SQH28739.1 Maltooligosyl trehalose synthase [Arcanobacterium haemolyticum]